MNTVKQFIYTSVAANPMTSESIIAMVDKARTRNSVYSVSSLLLFHTGSFLQVLEGPKAYIDLIGSSILRDPRHIDVKVLCSRAISQREFDDRPMNFVDTALSNSQPTGIVDYFQLQPLATLSEPLARQYLHFFYKDLCEENDRSAPFLRTCGSK